ncbi:MAG: GNAT family N-acetyltransferase [Lachnospiraceae bacterium]|nr:GNAT family N-acetyltransferase [Lachnospiraceae bacterium]
MKKEGVIVRQMTMNDYAKVHDLWMKIHKFGIRSIDDSEEGVQRFLQRNPTTSVVAEYNDEIVGSILCGHDGRTASFYHVCVQEEFRNQGIGKQMVLACMKALEKEHVNKISLVAFKDNEIGNQFWNEEGWEKREDLNLYDFVLNKANLTKFNC